MLSLNLTENSEETLVRNVFLPFTRGITFAQGLKDDVAFLKSDKKILIKTDSLTEGIHCKIGTAKYKMAHKLLARAISDVASKGGWPIGFTLAIFKPANWGQGEIADFMEGFKVFKIPLIGGDVSNSNNQYFSANITIFANHNGKISTRFNGKAGENIYITGQIGFAFLGFIGVEKFIRNYETPMPKIKLMQNLFSKYKITSSIDVSDGFIKDISSLLNASKIGADINIDFILEKKYQNYAKDMLTFGDDYEIIFTSTNEIKDKGVIQIGTTNKSRILNITGINFQFNSSDVLGYNIFK